MIIAAVQAGASLNVTGLACETGLVLGGLGALAWQIKRARREAPTGVEPWRASLLDFGIWVWSVCCAIYAGMRLLRLLDPGVGNPTPSKVQVLLLLCAFQFSALVVQLILLRVKRPFSPAPINRARLPARRAMGEAALAWLAAYPLLGATSLGWQFLLEQAQKIWPNLQTPAQETVTLVAQSSSFRETALMVVFAVLVAPVAEELFFRAGVYRFLKSQLPPKAAMVMASFLFALSHSNLETFLPLLVLGLLLTWLYERTGNIASPILFHALFNLATILLILLFPGSAVSAQSTP